MLFLDLLSNGLIIGAFYALMAIGLSLIFGILKIVNFAHGEFYMVGAYVYTLGALALGISPWLALPLAFLSGAIGLVSVGLIAIDGGPAFSDRTSLFRVFGYFGLFCATVLAMRVIVAVLRDGLN